MLYPGVYTERGRYFGWALLGALYGIVCILTPFLEPLMSVLFSSSLDEESHLSSCPPTLERYNNNLRDTLQRMVAAFTNLDTYLQLVAAQSKASRTSVQVCFDALALLISFFYF